MVAQFINQTVDLAFFEDINLVFQFIINNLRDWVMCDRNIGITGFKT